MEVSMKLYDQVLQLLKDNPELRSSDKKLLWEVWRRQGCITNGVLGYEKFVHGHLATPESVTRCRRKIQELHLELGASLAVKNERKRKAKLKGTGVYREPLIYHWNNKENTYWTEPLDTKPF